MNAGETLFLPHPAGGRLAVSLTHPGTPGPDAVVYVHGFGSKRVGDKSTALAAACKTRGWTYAAFDFRGHGDSSGSLPQLRASGLLADLDVVHAWLTSQGVRRVHLVGSSMGGFAAGWFALRRPGAVTACVLVAPALDFLQARLEALSEAERQEWRRQGRRRFRNQWLDFELDYALVEEAGAFALSELQAGWSVPALLIHGLADTVAPFGGSIRFVEETPARHVELHLIKDGDHRLNAHSRALARLTCDFLARWM